jgi:hypothetical protein
MDGRVTARGELIDGVRSALRAGDAAGARQLLDEACGEWPDDPHILEFFARAAYLELDFPAAGYNKNPITAQGITDAFHDAERCTDALVDVFERGRPFDEAMSDWQRTRDEHAMPMYEFTTNLATVEPPPPEMQQLLAAVGGNQAATDEFVSVVTATMSPVEFFDPQHIGQIMATGTDYVTSAMS